MYNWPLDHFGLTRPNFGPQSHQFSVPTAQLHALTPTPPCRLAGSFDGVTAAEFGSDWLTSLGGQTLAGPLQFTSAAMLTTPTLTVSIGGRLNGVAGGKLLDGRVPLDREVVLRQNVTIREYGGRGEAGEERAAVKMWSSDQFRSLNWSAR